MTVAQLLSSLSSQELAEWGFFFQIKAAEAQNQANAGDTSMNTMGGG